MGGTASGDGGPAQGPPQNWQQRRRRHWGLRQGHRLERAPTLAQAFFGLPHQLDHAAVALLGRGAKGKETVLQQHHALQLRPPLGETPGLGGFPSSGAGLCQRKTGHHIGN